MPYRIRVGKKQFNNAHYVTTIKRKNGRIVDINYSSVEVSKTFYEPKSLKTATKTFEALTEYCEVKGIDIHSYEIEEIENN